MTKKYEKGLEKNSLSNLCRMCEGKGLDHTGDKDALIARLVEWEKSQPEVEPEPEPPPEPAGEPPATKPEPEVEPPATEPDPEPEA